ncbi:MAG: tyrosine--tRNA ligase [Firmicutes bacterium]|nr:tyrosine--tRNA ligase [Bacillota bacterium]
MSNVMDTLRERGFIKQAVYEDDLYELLGKEKITFYAGFDPTADSLHVGHFLLVMAMAHMQRAGHRAIVLVGGGTAAVGDPSGRTDMRQMMTRQTIDHNVACFKKQLSRFIDFDDGKAIIVNNADWLLNLNYIDFLRDIGVHFSVNKMLSAECFKTRMEKGLSFLEFNYMLMQSYDFLCLNQKYGCILQIGGDDQWSNMLGGANLIRKKEHKDAFALTFTLLTNSEGKKMGKTQAGAVWLDPNKTSPYDFYQYWRNIDDADVEKCLKLLTFLPLDEIAELCAFRDERINAAKRRLAYEVTAIVHGSEEADKAQAAAEAVFGGGSIEQMPTRELSAAELEGIKIADLLLAAGITKSKGEGRRLIEGGGISVNNRKITAVDDALAASDITDGAFIIHKGKKTHLRITVK